MHGTLGGPAYKPKLATMAHDPRKAPVAVKGIKVGGKAKGKGKK